MHVFLGSLQVLHSSFLLELLLRIICKYPFPSSFSSVRKLSLKTAFKLNLRQDKCQHFAEGRW